MDAIDQCEPSTTPGPSSPTPPALLEACQISSDGNAYRFRTFRYDNLRDAITYARLTAGKEGDTGLLHSLDDLERAASLDTPQARSSPFSKQCQSVSCVYLGGSGWNLVAGDRLVISLADNTVELIQTNGSRVVSVPFDSLVALEVYGPGSQTTSAGLIGGGFGIEGAALGILAATAVNALTKKTTVSTFARIATGACEAFLYTSEMQPETLRMLLSRAIVRMEGLQHPRVQAESLPTQLAKLAALLDGGYLTATEYAQAKRAVLARQDEHPPGSTGV